MRTARRYYVYGVFRPSGIPMYIGHGCGDRWKRHDRKRTQNPHFAAILDQAGGDLPTVIIRSGLTKSEACEIEIALIKAIGREINGGPLVNLTDGGDGGTPGAVMTPEWRANRSRKAKEWYTPERCAAFSERMRGNKYTPPTRSEEWKAALSERMKGNTRTLGYKHTAEAKQKMADKWLDPEYTSNVIAARKARGQYSPEACAKRWETRRRKAAEKDGQSEMVLQ
jgi:hypothetical protein